MSVTLSSRWYYDEGEFGSGDVAYERVGSDHTPGSVEGAELFIVLQAPPGETRLLRNYGSDGEVQDLDLAFFKLLERKTSAEIDALMHERAQAMGEQNANGQQKTNAPRTSIAAGRINVQRSQVSGDDARLKKQRW